MQWWLLDRTPMKCSLSCCCKSKTLDKDSRWIMMRNTLQIIKIKNQIQSLPCFKDSARVDVTASSEPASTPKICFNFWTAHRLCAAECSMGGFIKGSSARRRRHKHRGEIKTLDCGAVEGWYEQTGARCVEVLRTWVLTVVKPRCSISLRGSLTCTVRLFLFRVLRVWSQHYGVTVNIFWKVT